MENYLDYYSKAPGANDNASGVSAILEIARILYNKKLDYDLQFVFFSGEEQNLLGSEQYAKFIRKNNLNLHRLINLDMI
jgi:Zn-dependent M28 family amino/carboxypeptidase